MGRLLGCHWKDWKGDAPWEPHMAPVLGLISVEGDLVGMMASVLGESAQLGLKPYTTAGTEHHDLPTLDWTF